MSRRAKSLWEAWKRPDFQTPTGRLVFNLILSVVVALGFVVLVSAPGSPFESPLRTLGVIFSPVAFLVSVLNAVLAVRARKRR